MSNNDVRILRMINSNRSGFDDNIVVVYDTGLHAVQVRVSENHSFMVDDYISKALFQLRLEL